MANAITHRYEKDVFTSQAELEREFLSEFEDGEYTHVNPLVKLNPYGSNPLSALIMFRTKTETAVTVTVRGKEKYGDISGTFKKSSVHILPVIGLYADFENTVELRLYQGDVSTVKIKTEPLDAKAAELVYMETTPEHLGCDLIVVTSPGGAYLTGFDYRGDVRFVITDTVRMGIKRARNGRILIGSPRLLKAPYFMSGVYEMDLLGKVYFEYAVPGGYHHDQFEMPCGDLLIQTEDLDRGTVEDMLVLVSRGTGEIKRVWDFKDFLTPGEGKSGNYTEHDWFHNNAVWYDEPTNSITLSGRHVDAIVNIDFDTGKLNWILGDPATWPEDKRKYFFTPQGEGFEWQYAQHACVVTPDGDIMCFDNGTLRSKHKEQYLLNRDNYSRGVRYRINTQEMTIREVWQFGKELGRDFFSQHISNVEYLGPEHYLLHSGGQQFYDDEPSEKIIGPNPDDPKVRCEGVTYEEKFGKVMLEMRVKGVYYRAARLNTDLGAINYETCRGKMLGALNPTAYVSDTASTKATEPLPEYCAAHLIEETDRYRFMARFEKDTQVYLVFDGEFGVRQYKIDTQGGPFSAQSATPYLESDGRNTCTSVHKCGLTGKFCVKVIIDGECYDTGLTLSADCGDSKDAQSD